MDKETVNYTPPVEPDIFQDEESEGAEREQILVKLAAFGQGLAKTRQDAIEGRASTGIEFDWLEDEQAYQGEEIKAETVPGRSTVLLNITRAYVDAAAAKVADMLLPTDEANFSISPTPVPELDDFKDDSVTPVLGENLEPLMQEATTPEGQVLQKPQTVKDAVEELQAAAAKAAERAKLRISDWLVECDYHNEFRKVIEDAAKLGTGILKGPFPTISKSSKTTDGTGEGEEVSTNAKIAPASKRIKIANFFPDPSCGDNIHAGAFVWERDLITGRTLRELGDMSGYILENITKCLEEGPASRKVNEDERHSIAYRDREQYEIWYYYGFVEKEDLEAAGCDCSDLDDHVPAIVVMVNDHVIKAALNPSSNGEFPFDVFPWQSRTDSWAGVGVARQLRTPQRMLTAATRILMDNAALSSGPQIIIRRNTIEPMDGQWHLTPRKFWWANEEADNRTVGDAITSILIPSTQNETQAIIQFALKMAEDVTGLPMILQGQQGNAPDTVGGMTMLSNNASSVLRRLARTADSCLIKPHIRRYYAWLMDDPDVPDEEKGDFKIDARGSSALVERDLHNQLLAQALQLSLNPAFGLSPARTLKEFLASKRIDVSKLEFTEQEKAQLAEQQKNAPPDPRVIAAQATVEATQIRTQAEVQKAQAQAEADQVEISTRMQDAREDRQFRERELIMLREIEMLKLANSEKISLDKIKAQLATTSLVEKNKRDLFVAEAELKQTEGSGI